MPANNTPQRVVHCYRGCCCKQPCTCSPRQARDLGRHHGQGWLPHRQLRQLGRSKRHRHSALLPGIACEVQLPQAGEPAGSGLGVELLPTKLSAQVVYHVA